ncbi:preprotein translocase subunit SecA [Aeoliella mucimassa]|uniref:Protein translocase subunit SecA n=1 Tax=Aeoliella mucimassa TaxID=2527972 RepID=A0A518ALP4_9BACT|nr:preprotein translocase subunit SecA [Aeoliella mucimassa]QDU55626.1 preprotein translocase subunit SecA [Aeoliella mucimassa]
METLERIWEFLSGIMNAVLGNFERTITSLFGSANARFLRKLQPKVDAINALEPRYEAMSDEELAAQTVKFRERLVAGETLDDLLVEAFAVCRESGKRFLGMRHYDVQLLGGMILHGGNIAEMVTGEGKTLVATLSAYLNALGGNVHVITVNDYLARRDMEWMGPVFTNLGLKVGAIYSGMDASARQEAYSCDITYGTNNEFGFDYLRDNMRRAARDDDRFAKRDQQAQGHLTYAIIDEVDNILIDEARTPLIISGPAEDDITKYLRADKVARGLKKDKHFEVKEKEHTVSLTDEGVREAEKLAGVESFYTAGNMQWPHLIDNSLKAHYLYKRDVNYVIQDGKIVIVDEFTGRLMEGRQWSDGLHQAVEAKEGVQIKEENQTLATITLQNFFKLYDKLSGMTGTALTEAGEFWKIYQLDVIGVPTNKPLQRISHPDVIYRTEREKYEAIAEEIEGLIKYDQVQLKSGEIIRGEVLEEHDGHVLFMADDTKKKEKIPRDKIAEVQKKGRPILVGTVSIEKSEKLSNLLNGRGIKHEVLNAKQHKREAEIVSQAGRMGAVTIATNMAGRGTDIILGGNPENMAWAELQQKYDSRLDVPQEEWDSLTKQYDEKFGMSEQGKIVRQIGGLHIVGTERHEARRIDLQLRGRCGRQGDPGSSRFYLSLEDDLMRIFAGEWVKNMLTRLGMQEGEAIESKMVSRRIEGAQKKREESNFEIRKNLLEYDEVMDEQRKRVYSFRQQILDGVNCRDLITDMIRDQIDHYLSVFLDPHYGVDSFAAAASNLLGVQLDARDYRKLSYEEAQRVARDEAQRMAESQVFDAIEENLPEEVPDEWNWNALAKWANARWGFNYNERELKKVGRDDVAEHLIKRAHEAIDKIDLSSCERYLDPDYSVKTACSWLTDKFSIDITLEEAAKMSNEQLIQTAHEQAQEAYDQRESEYPVMAGLYRFTGPAAGAAGLGREDLVAWAQKRFSASLSVEDLKNKQRDEIKQVLFACSKDSAAKANQLADEARERVETLFAGNDGANLHLGLVTGGNGKLDDFTTWLQTSCGSDITAEELAQLNRDEALRRVSRVVEDKFRPEMRRMERELLLQILDTAWKEHLLAMDHLRSSVGLRGYAQVDPKVEYKREGMRMFEQMWDSVGAYVTDLVFKMEQLDERFVQSTWKETNAIHEEAPKTNIGEQQQAAIEASGGAEQKLTPIRNRTERVGRNAPCPCGSGKKYKQCCMRKD